MKATASGVAIRFRARHSHWHAESGHFVLAFGQPTLGGKRAAADELLKRYLDSPARQIAVGGRFCMIMVDMQDGGIRLQTDRFGVWPVCWAVEGSCVAFSDRADCVPLAGARNLDHQAVFNYAYFHIIPAPRTIFRSISRLEPATELHGRRNRPLSFRTTWTPRFSSHRAESRRALSEAFLDILQESVATEATGCRSGAFLSGGTDSSTVAGMLKQATGSATTFSIGFDEAGYDEMEYARIAARHFGTQHNEHYVTPDELVSAVPLVAKHYDQPFGNSSAVPAFICARLARQQGFEKLLAGDGGDELFGGNTRYAKQKIFNAWWSVPPLARQALSPLLANGLTRNLPALRKAASYIDQASVPLPARLETYNLLTRIGMTRVFSDSFLSSVDFEEPTRLQADIYGRTSGALVDRMLAYDWRFTLADSDLPKVCGSAQLANVDVGFPLLSDALVDLSTKLAPSDKVRGLKLRHFFKQSLSNFLPPAIIRKKKHGFGLPVGKWLVTHRAFGELARDSISALAARRLLHPGLVDELFSRRLQEHAGYHGELAWILMMLEQWLAEHPDVSFSEDA